MLGIVMHSGAVTMPMLADYRHHGTAAFARVGQDGAAEPPMAARTAANAISPASNVR